MKFSEMTYTRPDIDALLARCKELTAKAAAADSGEPALRLTPGPRRLAGPGGRGVWHPDALPRATPVAGPSE